MDMPHQTTAYVLRPWLKAMGFSIASFMAFLFMGALLRLCQIITYDCLVILEWIVGALFLVKILVWLYV
jgi:hypothetical protein